MEFSFVLGIIAFKASRWLFLDVTEVFRDDSQSDDDEEDDDDDDHDDGESDELDENIL